MPKQPLNLSDKNLVQIGVITSPFGLKGEVFVFPMTDTTTTSQWFNSTLYDKHGEPRFVCHLKHSKGKQIAIAIDGITNRTQAELLNGEALFVPRNMLPEPEEDSYYFHDLEGLELHDLAGKAIGTLVKMHDFGAAPLMEILLNGEKQSRYLPFTREIATEIDLPQRRLTVHLPEEIE
jgi:16S rRNA processing protein RimM